MRKHIYRFRCIATRKSSCIGLEPQQQSSSTVCFRFSCSFLALFLDVHCSSCFLCLEKLSGEVGLCQQGGQKRSPHMLHLRMYTIGRMEVQWLHDDTDNPHDSNKTIDLLIYANIHMLLTFLVCSRAT